MSIVNYYKTESSANDISESFAKIVFVSGVILVTTMLLDFCATRYMYYLLNLEHGYGRYWDFIDNFQDFFKIIFWASKVCFILFYLGMLPILMAKKAYIPIAVSCLLLSIYGTYTYFDNETFNLVFDPEKYKLTSLFAHCIVLIINLILYLYIYIGSKDKHVNLASRLLLITCVIDIVNIISYSIMFSIDSSHFTERFSDFIEMFKFYYSYMSSPIHICALSLILYQIKLFLKHKEETFFEN